MDSQLSVAYRLMHTYESQIQGLLEPILGRCCDYLGCLYEDLCGTDEDYSRPDPEQYMYCIYDNMK